MEDESNAMNYHLPDLKTILFPIPPVQIQTLPHSNLRRSPRKHVDVVSKPKTTIVPEMSSVKATSNQRRQSPAKRSPVKRLTAWSSTEAGTQTQAQKYIFDDLLLLPRAQTDDHLRATADTRQNNPSMHNRSDLRLTRGDMLMLPLSKNGFRTDELTGSDSEPSFILGSARPKMRKGSSAGKSVMSLMTEAARKVPVTASPTKASRTLRKTKDVSAASKFVLNEAACLEDLADSDANDAGEDDDTDLSGFVVDDNAELSYHESMESNDEDEIDSEHERRTEKIKLRQQRAKAKPRRRLQRGRRRVDDSDQEVPDSHDLTDAFKNMKLDLQDKESKAVKNVEPEVIDLVSPSPEPKCRPANALKNDIVATNLFDKLNALRLSPPRVRKNLEAPSKSQSSVPALTPTETSDGQTDEDGTLQPKTPPATPPRSPTKLKSPRKLLSPAKRNEIVPRSPHRQSMDAFWDLNVVNEWNDRFSPKKAPLASPRKGTKYFDIWSDSEDDKSIERLEESSDELPSPCESPTKMRVITSPLKSPEKAARRRAQEEKKAKLAQKNRFDASKDALARELFDMLDQNITNGQISKLSESTGGVSIIWSKNLRSTAGRANWKRTKTSSSPMKNTSKSDQSVQHFASIELAVKVIDRPERLFDTLAHEFCHLANFMISGVIKEPHGAQFQKWAKQTTEWLRSSSGRPEWQTIKITTKHGYVIEHKYLWVCAGRTEDNRLTPPDFNDGLGCGAEYGRHSKSIATDKHRCGVCHGFLIQIRPKPRASPKKNSTSPVKNFGKRIGLKEIEESVKEIKIVELSD